MTHIELELHRRDNDFGVGKLCRYCIAFHTNICILIKHFAFMNLKCGMGQDRSGEFGKEANKNKKSVTWCTNTMSPALFICVKLREPPTPWSLRQNRIDLPAQLRLESSHPSPFLNVSSVSSPPGPAY